MPPYLLFYLGHRDQGEQIYGGLLPVLTLTASALLAALAITLLSKARPDWLYGIGAAAAVAVLSAVTWGFVRHDSNAGFSVSSAGFVLAYTFLAGRAGASIASLASRPLARERPDGKLRLVRPWHVGAAVAVAELISTDGYRCSVAEGVKRAQPLALPDTR